MPWKWTEGSSPQNEIIYHNPTVGVLYKAALKREDHSISNSGALIAYSGVKTGRSPKDKRIVDEAQSRGDVWWGPVNIPMNEYAFEVNRETARNYLKSCRELFVIDGYAGWDPAYQIKVRIVCSHPYHALFMRNMLIRPNAEQLANFGKADWIVYNAGHLPANHKIEGVDSPTSVAVNFHSKSVVILGTEYAGEMKKGIFTVLNYELPKRGVLSMHCSANEGSNGDVALFFGLSGTGKTTLSADAKRHLIGDDEHAWTGRGVFNIEGGCYAKTINLSAEGEPEIYDAIRYGALLENVIYDPDTAEVDYRDTSITQNTRCSYPIEYIQNAKIPCVGGHPKNIIFLTCDAFGILPPVSQLTPEQAMYHFVSGYTAKVAGTEVGVVEPEATFSACFGAAFLVWHPMVYAELLAKKIRKHKVKVWLVNTGWTGGGYGVGHRMKLAHTRSIIDAILDGTLAKTGSTKEPQFGLAIPKSVPDVPTSILKPANTWRSKKKFEATAKKLAGMFQVNFKRYEDQASPEVIAAGPE